MLTNLSSSQLSRLSRRIGVLERRIKAECKELDVLRTKYITLVCPFKPGDMVKYMGFDKSSLVYRVQRIAVRGHTYVLICVGKNRKKSYSKITVSPLKVEKLTSAVRK